MFGFVASPAVKWLAGAVFALSALGLAYYKGYAAEHERFTVYKAQAEALYNQQVKETERLNAAQVKATQKAEERHAKDISTLRSVYDRMRKPAGNRAMPGAPDPAVDPAQATAYYLDAAPELATQCGETTQQLISLQAWVIDQSELK